jgi:hypothetical protein
MEKFNLQSCKSAKYAKTVLATAPKAGPVGNGATNWLELLNIYNSKF